jgi:hypothetical protein
MANKKMAETKTASLASKPKWKLSQWIDGHPVLRDLFVTIVGVWIAFWLTGLGEKYTLDRTTKQRLYLAVFEIQYIVMDANNILSAYSRPDDPTKVDIEINSLRAIAAEAAFQDPHISSILPLRLVFLLGAYLNSINTLNQVLQMDQHNMVDLRYII